MEKTGESEKSESVAPDGGQARSDSSESESSSSSSEDEVFASPPPNKRRKYSKRSLTHAYDPRVDSLLTQMSYISNYVAHNLPSTSSQQDISVPNTGFETEHTMQQDQFLTIPGSTHLSLGEVSITHDQNRIIPPADPKRLEILNRLQQFDTQAWKGIRYKKELQSCMASPGFTGLKINEELCHFNKTKDYLASTESIMAGLSNVVLEQRHLVQESLQSILDWASKDPSNLNVNNLFEKFSSKFGPGSAVCKNSELNMQIICGKRAECIEMRRERILKEIGNPNLRATLHNVPPSSEYLFSREALQPIIQSLGGSQTWLNTPAYLAKKKSHNFREQSSFRRQTKQTHSSKNTNIKVDRKSRYVKKPFRRNNNPEHPNTNTKQN